MEVYLVDMLEYPLSKIASQSRNEHPKVVEGLFEKTIDWGHDSIQEFVEFIFHIENVSRVLLAQLTRHRIASYNVMSHRHVPPSAMVVPNGIRSAKGEIELDNGNIIKWGVDKDGKCEFSGNNGDVLLEDIRYFFPSAIATNLYMKINGRSLRNFLRLRMDKHAQWEIRALANAIYKIVKDLRPEIVYNL